MPWTSWRWNTWEFHKVLGWYGRSKSKLIDHRRVSDGMELSHPQTMQREDMDKVSMNGLCI